jgi:hypothetical protein
MTVGLTYIYRILRTGPTAEETARGAGPAHCDSRESDPRMADVEPSSLALFSASTLAIAMLIYLFLDRFDLGILFGAAGNDARRNEMLGRDRPHGPASVAVVFLLGPCGVRVASDHRVHRGSSIGFSAASLIGRTRGEGKSGTLAVLRPDDIRYCFERDFSSKWIPNISIDCKLFGAHR